MPAVSPEKYKSDLDHVFNTGVKKRDTTDHRLGSRRFSRADMGDGSGIQEKDGSVKIALRAKLTKILAHDIAPIPFDLVNKERKEECKTNFRLYCETYFPNRFNLRWSADHLHLFSTIESAIFAGDGQVAYAFPRGSGKTTIAECAGLWCAMYGHRHYIVLVSATGDNAKHAFGTFIDELDMNDLLNEDFPEICYPIRILNGVWKKAETQTYNGERTRFEMSKDSLLFPIIKGYDETNGNILRSLSINGHIRGIKARRPDGSQARPDLIIVDDPQSDKSARSQIEIGKLERTIDGAIRGLAGPGKPITILMPCTVIQKNDVAERFLDRDKRPDWQGHRVKFFKSMPENMELWQQYHEIRKESFRNGTRGKEATDFYASNREELDKGAVVYWIDRFNPRTELSAIQSGMNLYFYNPITFASEYQNEPLAEILGERPRLDLQAGDIMDRFSGIPLGKIPNGMQHLTTGIDIQGKILYYVTTAWTEDFGGVIVEHGAYPKQNVDYYIATDPSVTFNDKHPNVSLGPQVHAGLKYLADNVLNRQWETVDGFAKSKVERTFADANWNIISESVYAFCQEYEQAGFLPVMGRGIQASSIPMKQYALKAHEKYGNNWIRKSSTSKTQGKHVQYDTNFWKSLVAERLIAPKGSKNALLLPGTYNSRFQLLADHLASEYPETTFGRNRYVDEWKRKPAAENHFFDCLIMSAVAASYAGLIPHTVTVTKNEAGELETQFVPKKKRTPINMPGYK